MKTFNINIVFTPDGWLTISAFCRNSNYGTAIYVWEFLIFCIHTQRDAETCLHVRLSFTVFWTKVWIIGESVHRPLQRSKRWWGTAQLEQEGDGPEPGPYERRGKRARGFLHPKWEGCSCISGSTGLRTSFTHTVMLQRWWGRTRSLLLFCLVALLISACDTARLFRCCSLERHLPHRKLKHSWALPRMVRIWRGRYMFWARWAQSGCAQPESMGSLKSKTRDHPSSPNFCF